MEAHWCVIGFSHLNGFQEKIDAFLQKDHLVHPRKRKSGVGSIDLRSAVDNLRIRDAIPYPEMNWEVLPPSFREVLKGRKNVIDFTLRGRDGQRPRVGEVMRWVFSLTEEEIRELRFIKIAER